jgi:hypothetical protein
MKIRFSCLFFLRQMRRDFFFRRPAMGFFVQPFGRLRRAQLRHAPAHHASFRVFETHQPDKFR